MHGIFCGKLVAAQGSTSFTSVLSAFGVSFQGTAAADHRDLVNIGAITHDDIDLHIGNVTTNPHQVSILTLADVDPALAPAAGHQLYYDSVNGYWTSAPLLIPGSKQTIQSSFGSIPQLSGTTNLLQAATAPLITDGTQLWTTAFTPSAVNAEIKVAMSFAFAISNAASEIVVSLFRDNTCIGAMIDTASSSNGYQTVSFVIKDPGPFIAGVPVTYQARVGRNGGNATWYINTNSAAENMGGVLANNAYTIEEVVVV